MKKIWQWILNLFGIYPKNKITIIKEETVNIQTPFFTPVIEKEKPIKVPRKRVKLVRPDNLSGKHPPRPMTEREKELFAIKPNLQYCVNKGML